MDYQDGFEDGVKFAREVIVTNIRLWAETSEDGAASVSYTHLTLPTNREV